MIETVSGIVAQCDGVRCDMAMLLLNQVFERTWGDRAGQRPRTEYWGEVIPAVKKRTRTSALLPRLTGTWSGSCSSRVSTSATTSGFMIAWNTIMRKVSGFTLVLNLPTSRSCLRFLENHDEPRAATAFSRRRSRLPPSPHSLPGARLFHEGQFEGRKVRCRYFWADGRRSPSTRIASTFYAKLLAAINAPIFRDGEWRLCGCSGWPDNQSFRIWWPGAGSRTMIGVSSQSILVTRLFRPGCGPVGRCARGNVAFD